MSGPFLRAQTGNTPTGRIPSQSLPATFIPHEIMTRSCLQLQLRGICQPSACSRKGLAAGGDGRQVSEMVA